MQLLVLHGIVHTCKNDMEAHMLEDISFIFVTGPQRLRSRSKKGKGESSRRKKTNMDRCRRKMTNYRIAVKYIVMYMV